MEPTKITMLKNTAQSLMNQLKDLDPDQTAEDYIEKDPASLAAGALQRAFMRINALEQLWKEDQRAFNDMTLSRFSAVADWKTNFDRNLAEVERKLAEVDLALVGQIPLNEAADRRFDSLTGRVQNIQDRLQDHLDNQADFTAGDVGIVNGLSLRSKEHDSMIANLYARIDQVESRCSAQYKQIQAARERITNLEQTNHGQNLQISALAEANANQETRLASQEEKIDALNNLFQSLAEETSRYRSEQIEMNKHFSRNGSIVRDGLNAVEERLRQIEGFRMAEATGAVPQWIQVGNTKDCADCGSLREVGETGWMYAGQFFCTLGCAGFQEVQLMEVITGKFQPVTKIIKKLQSD